MAKRMVKGKRIKNTRASEKEPLTDRIEKVKTPEWVLEICSDMPKELPKGFVKRLHEGLEEAKRLERGDPREYAIFLSAMNNFSVKDIELDLHREVFGEEWFRKKLKEKIGEPDELGNNPTSELKKNQTYGEFYQTIIRVIKECGLSPGKAKEIRNEKGTIESNRYLLPAFLKLLEMGYETYPDLTA